jgi:uncharacterized protein
MSENVTITLIGKRMANVGTEFIFRGPVEECDSCRLKNTCLNLDKNKKYKVVAVRNGQEHECMVHDTGVKAVDVSPASVVVAIESRKAFNGSRITYDPQKCQESCTLYMECHPEGLVPGDKYTISGVMEDISGQCEKGLNLKKVELKP